MIQNLEIVKLCHILWDYDEDAFPLIMDENFLPSWINLIMLNLSKEISTEQWWLQTFAKSHTLNNQANIRNLANDLAQDYNQF